MRFLLMSLALVLLIQPLHAQTPGKGLTPLPDKPQAPDFVLSDMDGREYRLRAFRGKVLIVNFWATWCPPCRAEMPSMQRAWEQLKREGILLLAINVGEDRDAVFRFGADYPVDFPLLLDSDAKVAEAWPMQGLPTTFVVDPQGRLVYRAIGAREWDDPQLLSPVRALKP
jgi:thiol-disulfide isomerase/thioredoxin